jgi:bifunctional non-homologous end joining protein LigD
VPKWRDDPAKVRPMLASLDPPPVAQPGMVYEPKYDGIRALIDIRPATDDEPVLVEMYSRNGHAKGHQFPAIVTALKKLAPKLDGPVLLDGELVAVDAKGHPLPFGRIQGRIHLTAASDILRAEKAQPAALVIFDILRDNDRDVRGLSLAARRLRLQDALPVTVGGKGLVRLSEIVADDGRQMLERAEREGWEGLIGKDGGSVYHSGRRSPAWRKLKLLKRDTFIVGGWTDPQNTRAHFGSLVLGVPEAGRLRWVGNVGTGFDQKELTRVADRLKKLAAKTCPFADPPKAIAKAHWVKPTMTVEVQFTEMTSEGMLRHPVYLGERDDVRVVTSRRQVDEPVDPLDALVARLHALEDARRDGELSLPNGDRLKVTNLHKVFWPELGLTKGDLLRYYVEVSPYALPVIDDRPMIMRRFPNGIAKHAFYQQRHPDRVPKGVRREILPEDVDPIDPEEGTRERLIGGSLTTLLYMAQLASISLDPWFSRVADPLHQDFAAIDLDPGDGVSFARVLDVARWVKEELDRLKIPAVAKTSGASGMHIYVRLPPDTTYETGQLLCHLVATLVSSKHPRVATIERMVRKRPKGTVYVDYLQNILGKSLAAAYSARASDYAGASTPLTWAEVAEGVDPRDFTIRTAPARFRQVGDLWTPIRTGPAIDIERVLNS